MRIDEAADLVETPAAASRADATPEAAPGSAVSLATHRQGPPPSSGSSGSACRRGSPSAPPIWSRAATSQSMRATFPRAKSRPSGRVSTKRSKSRSSSCASSRRRRRVCPNRQPRKSAICSTRIWRCCPTRGWCAAPRIASRASASTPSAPSSSKSTRSRAALPRCATRISRRASKTSASSAPASFAT